MTRPTRALSIRAPWTHYILHGGKAIENRSRWSSFRGPVLIHTSLWWRTIEVIQTMDRFDPIAWAAGGPRVTMEDIRRSCGHIVGVVDIVDCRTSSDSPWFFGPYGYQLTNPRALSLPIPCKGALGFFRPPADVLAQVYTQLGALGAGEAA